MGRIFFLFTGLCVPTDDCENATRIESNGFYWVGKLTKMEFRNNKD